MTARPDVLLAITLALATFVVVSTAFAAIMPEMTAPLAALSCRS